MNLVGFHPADSESAADVPFDAGLHSEHNDSEVATLDAHDVRVRPHLRCCGGELFFTARNDTEGGAGEGGADADALRGFHTPRVHRIHTGRCEVLHSRSMQFCMQHVEHPFDEKVFRRLPL